MYEGRSSAPDGNGEERVAAECAGSRHCVYTLGICAEGSGTRIAQDASGLASLATLFFWGYCNL